MADVNVGRLVAETHRRRKSNVADNVSNSNILLAMMKSKGKIEMVTGGRTLTENLEYAEADFQRYSGWDLLSVQPANIVDIAEYTPVQAAVPIAISGRDLRINRGKEAIIKKVTTELKNATKTMDNNLSSDFYSDGTATNQMAGLQAQIADDPTTGTVGGIDRSVSTNAWWRNQVVDVTADTVAGAVNSTGVKQGMNLLWVRTTRGNDKTNLITADSTYYILYLEGLQDIQRLSDPKVANMGFENIKYQSAPVVYDGDSGHPVGMYFINTDYCALQVYEGANYDLTDEKMSTNQDGFVRHLLFMGNLVFSNCARQGRLKS